VRLEKARNRQPEHGSRSAFASEGLERGSKDSTPVAERMARIDMQNPDVCQDRFVL
jgi:hypothetical protein